jgi:hypothetical protein
MLKREKSGMVKLANHAMLRRRRILVINARLMPIVRAFGCW